MGKRAYSLLDIATYMDLARHYQVVFLDLSWRLGSSVSYYKWQWGSTLLMKRQTGSCLTLLEAIILWVLFGHEILFKKVDVQNFRAREVDWKTANKIQDFKQHGTLIIVFCMWPCQISFVNSFHVTFQKVVSPSILDGFTWNLNCTLSYM